MENLKLSVADEARRDVNVPARSNPRITLVHYTGLIAAPQTIVRRLSMLEGIMSYCPYVSEARSRKGRCFSLTRIRDGGGANNSDVVALTGLVLDFDGKTARRDIERAFGDYWYLAYSTYRHSADEERWRVVLPLANEHDPRALPLMYDWARGKGLRPDSSADAPAHKFFYPVRPPGAQFITWVNDGTLLDLSHLKPPPEPKKSPNRMRQALGRDNLKDSPTSFPANDDSIMHVLGAPAGTRLKQKICSLVAQEEHASTWFYRGSNGRLMYHIAHSRTVRKVNPGKRGSRAETDEDAANFTLPCALVLASQITGKIIARVGPPELRMWDLRLAHMIGHLQAASIPHEPLPDEDSSVPRITLTTVYEGFIHAMGVRAAFNEGEIQPIPFSWRFAARWCGLASHIDGGEALDLLMKWGLIRSAGKYIAYGKPCNLLTTSALEPWETSKGNISSSRDK